MTHNIRSKDPLERFAFGENWAHFLKYLDNDRIHEAEISLQEKLCCESLKDKTFLDIGSGSGLFSLAAHRLGAKVYSFDFDENSVNCSKHLKSTYGTDKAEWWIGRGSILDEQFLSELQLEKFDIVYSWGVLHHTGHMYEALENASKLVQNQGLFFISIYNDQGNASQRWTWIKKKYSLASRILRPLLLAYTLLRLWTVTFMRDLITSGNPAKSWFNYGTNNRGMSAWHDVVDWTGGYPFEVAKPEEIFNFLKCRGFELIRMKTCAGGHGCNEFVFMKK